MKRRTLDVIFSAGGVMLAALLLVLGLVMQNQANFADTYVTDQQLVRDVGVGEVLSLIHISEPTRPY